METQREKVAFPGHTTDGWQSDQNLGIPSYWSKVFSLQHPLPSDLRAHWFLISSFPLPPLLPALSSLQVLLLVSLYHISHPQ